MTQITLVMAYYMNPGMLRVQYDHTRSLPARIRDQVGVVVVDDGSPESPAWVEDIGVPLQVFRIDVDNRWGQDAARNIGVHYAENSWILMTDIDHLVPKKTWQKLIEGTWKETEVCSFSRVSAPEMARYKHHPNTWFINRKLFDQVGGYDERYVGYYGTDGEFRNRLLKVATEQRLKEHIVRYPRTIISDASTTTYLRKQPEDRAGIERVRQEIAALPEDQRKPVRFRYPFHRVVAEPRIVNGLSSGEVVAAELSLPQ